MSLTTPESVRKLQEALHAKAKAEPGFRFYLLYDKVYRADTLAHAYRCAKENGGAAGVDGQTFEDIEKYGVERWLGELAQALRTKAYRPEAVRRVYIPKPDGKQRPLGIPTVKDRVVQTSAVLVLEPIFEADLPPEQYAYRAGRGALDAVRKVHSLLNTGHTEVVDADLSGYFDSIPHAELMKSVARRIVDRHMLRLVKMWLTMPVEEADERGRKQRTTRARDEKRGTPQGAPISPLLSNLYMRRFVLGWKALGHERRLDAHIVNYADDFVICCRRKGDEALRAMQGMMERLKLTVNETKTRLCRAPEEAFDFLGYTLGWCHSPKKPPTIHRHSPVEEAGAAAVSGDTSGDRAAHVSSGGRLQSGRTQSDAPRLGELLLPGAGQQSLSDRGRAYSPKAASVVVRKASASRTRHETLFGRTPLRGARPRSVGEPDARPAVGEGMNSCPRAGCGKSARPVR